MEVQQIGLYNLPTELIIKIFDNLTDKELLELSLTCTLFHDIISKSKRLSKKFTVHLTHKRKGIKWNGTRKYENFKFSSCSQYEFEDFVKVFHNHGKDVKCLKFIENSFKVECLWAILALCPNVKSIQFHNNHPDRLVEDGVFLPHLEMLDYDGESLCVANFYKCNRLRRLSLSGSHSWPEVYLERFLMRQKKLKVLRLNNYEIHSFIFNNPYLSENIRFSLVSLSLINVVIPQDDLIFSQFVNLHKNSLRHLEIGNATYEILRQFQSFRKLRHIKIISIFEREDINLDNYITSPMLQVEHLIIENQNVTNYATIFPNLITLEIQNVHLKPIEIEQLKRLRKLTIINCKKVSKISINSVRELRFIACKFISFNIVSNSLESIEKLSIKDCKNVEWLIKFLGKNQLNLMEFELIGTEMSRDLFKKIFKMQPKVDKLTVSSNRTMNIWQLFNLKFKTAMSIVSQCLVETDFY